MNQISRRKRRNCKGEDKKDYEENTEKKSIIMAFNLNGIIYLSFKTEFKQ
jgi:hypothetical protein